MMPHVALKKKVVKLERTHQRIALQPFLAQHLNLRRKKTRVRGLSYGIVCELCVILGLAVFVELRLVTDRQSGRMDVQTDTR